MGRINQFIDVFTILVRQDIPMMPNRLIKRTTLVLQSELQQAMHIVWKPLAQPKHKINLNQTYFKMLITSRTACTATSYSLSNVMATIRSLNLLVKSSSLPFNSSEAYKGWRA